MGFFDFLKEVTKDDLRAYDYEIDSAAYFQKDIEKLVSNSMPINHDYIMEKFPTGTTVVWKYDTCVVKKVLFIKEPKNPHDKNAIKIQGGMYPVGYIPADKNVHFKKFMDDKKIYSSYLIISGGDKKRKSKPTASLERINFRVTLRVLVKK